MSDSCRFCGENDSAALERHHVIPQRHGGSDKAENLVTVCASCHRKLEDLYDDEFYAKLGVSDGEHRSLSHRERVEKERKELTLTIADTKPAPTVDQWMQLSEEEKQNTEIGGWGTPVDVVVANSDYSDEKARRRIEKMMEQAELYMPNPGYVQLIPSISPEDDDDD